MLFVCMHVRLFPFNTIYQYLYPRFKLVFSLTLYKFIVRAFWVWVHSSSGFKSKLVLTDSNLNPLLKLLFLPHKKQPIYYLWFIMKIMWLFPFNTIYQYLYPRFRLAFSPTLYKFIVRAFWAWVHSCSGFKSKLVLTDSNLNPLLKLLFLPHKKQQIYYLWFIMKIMWT